MRERRKEIESHVHVCLDVCLAFVLLFSLFASLAASRSPKTPRFFSILLLLLPSLSPSLLSSQTIYRFGRPRVFALKAADGRERGRRRERRGGLFALPFPNPKKGYFASRSRIEERGRRETNRGGQQQRQGFYLGQIRLLNSTDAFFFFLCSLLPQPPYLSTAGRRLKERTKGRERLEGREEGRKGTSERRDSR